MVQDRPSHVVVVTVNIARDLGSVHPLVMCDLFLSVLGRIILFQALLKKIIKIWKQSVLFYALQRIIYIFGDLSINRTIRLYRSVI